MNFLEFLPYHNRLIKFRYKGETLEGVVIDVVPDDAKNNESEYLYIPRDQLDKWKDPDKIDDDNIKKELLNPTHTKVVDIEDIEYVPEKLFDEIEKINIEINDYAYLNLPLEYNFEKNEPVSFSNFFNKKLEVFKDKINEIQIPSQHHYSYDIKRIHDNIEAVKKCIEYYYNGRPSCAYNEIGKIFSTISRSYKFLKSKKEKKNNSFYRIRVEDGKTNFKPFDLFHIPFQKRNEITTKRYSIPGFPCLYLSNSIYLAWEEMDKPKMDDIHIIMLKNQCDISYIDLTFDIYNNYDEFNNKKLYEQLEILALWPLIAACSVKVYNENDIFKPEYIVPQLMLQWTRQKQEVDAIKYSSTRVDLNTQKGVFHNMVLPVKEIKDDGCCDQLKNIFETTPAVSLELLKLSSVLPNGINLTSFNNENDFKVKQVEIIKGIPEDYKLTKFGQLEFHLNKYIPLSKIK